MSKKLVIHNGVKVSADWPAKIKAAQSLTHYTVGGKKLARIPFGDDDPRWGNQPCLDCAVLKGQLHVPNCEYEKCPACGKFLAELGGCFCDTEELREPDEESIAPARQSPLARKKAEETFSAALVLVLLIILPMWGAVAMLVGSAIALVAYTVLFRERLRRRGWLKTAVPMAVAAVVAAAIAVVLSRGHWH